ncbi:hypothetical protein KVH31_13330 [Streptomyces olivaceus]|uniref:hypothetical protein n=1 Tax=Streptomyces olivaceus TaxID=47716 RepID=UPI001CCC1563|nr:hypothetical protein [Streptomyces olivaceus]MBZ6207480.1 hypothetical protein [Streptomyces olivaceus]
MIVAEALDALWSLGVAVLIWLALIVTALVLAVEALAVAVCVAVRAVQRLWRPERRARPAWALRGRAARCYARRRPDYDHAA